jgi:hypothetical protein
LEEFGIDPEDILGQIANTLNFNIAKEKLKQNIIDRVENEFGRLTAFTEKLIEKQSLIIPLKMTAKDFTHKNYRMISQKLKKVIQAQAKTILVSDIQLIVTDPEGETARQKVIRLLREKQIQLGHRGLRHLWKEGRLKSEDFPIIYDNKVYFLENIQDYWKLMCSPDILEKKDQIEQEEQLKVFLGGFDKEEKKRVGMFLQNEFGLVRLTRQKVINDVLFGVDYSGLLGKWKEEEKQEEEIENENEELEDEDENTKVLKEIQNLLNSKKNILVNQTQEKINWTMSHLIEDCRKSGERVSSCFDVDYLNEDSPVIYSCQNHLSKQDPGRSILQNFYNKFEEKCHQMLNTESKSSKTVDFFEDQSKHLIKDKVDPEKEEENKQKEMEIILQNMINGLSFDHQENRMNELSIYYKSLVESTENTFSLKIHETDKKVENLTIPELVRNFSNDFWIRKIKTKLLENQIISDEDLIYLLLIRLKFADVQKRGFVLEDFPQNLKQKRILDSHNVIPHLVFLIDGLSKNSQTTLKEHMKQLLYLRSLQSSLMNNDFSKIVEIAMKPPQNLLPKNSEPSDSDAEISEDDKEEVSALDNFKVLLNDELRSIFAECLSLFSSKEKPLELLSNIVSSKLLLKNRFEVLTVLYLYKEHYDNVRVLNCKKDSLFNLLLVKKSLRCMKAKLNQIHNHDIQTRGYSVSGLGLSRANILKNLNFIDGQFICALNFVKEGKRELLECSRENMVVIGDIILPVKSECIKEVVEK